MSNTIMSKVIMSKTRVIMSNFFRHNDSYNYVENFRVIMSNTIMSNFFRKVIMS